ncbi:iron complex transport system substrate-binding protein [Larkinella arboricola]|uniref:Iron complex transport system substrate-binding protein n=1 Tax=Larkinella arboricola TaxID=643671 RepID=A0A327XBJ8_LARAB|nr:ABC transporter substrate-binding protein [Larkinella arboricola]RAK03253.1 iron complex transport system substrate-binding protein [Larkinella arboricola]
MAKKIYWSAFLIIVSLAAYAQGSKTERIVSLSGTLTEIVCDLGLQNQIVGTDVTSTYPATMAKVPKVGHNRNISAEAVLALRPTVVIAVRSNGSMDIKPELFQQFRSAGVKTLIFDQELSVAGTKKLITEVAKEFNASGKAAAIIRKLDADLAKVRKPAKAQKVLFIYARGTGTMMVSGRNTPIEKIVQLAGAQNAFNDFDNFKPLTPEALVVGNPDDILLFTSGLESLGGIDGLLNVQGVAQTNAGKNRRVIEMDGQLLTGFGPRLGLAVQELSRKLNQELTLK